jgi:hypothetical protein
MQPWQIKALELEASGLKHLDGFIHEHALGFSHWSHLSFAGFVGVGIERCIATQREENPRPCPASPFHPSAGTATTAPGHVRPVSAAAPFGALRSR